MLARKAARPVKLVFTRREEFIAPDKRREGMVIEIESGVKNDGTITARRGHLIIDNGAYTADSAFFSELAAMHVHGPYKTQNAHIDAHCVYTNHQPSGSVRAPTAPQACWALEQHTDELAAAIGMDPVDFRRKQLHRHRRRGPDAAGLPADRPAGVHRQRRRDERLRPGAARGRGDRPRRRLVADLRRARRAPT